MSGKELYLQYKQINAIVQKNIESIRELINHAKALHGIIETMTDSSDAKIKSALEVQLNGIYDSIDKLVKQTDDLFETYQRVAKEIFN